MLLRAGLACLLATTGACRHRDQLRQTKVQQAEIQRLQTEMNRIDAERDQLPPLRSEQQLTEIRMRLDRQEKDLDRLTGEIEALQIRKAGLEKEFLSYRARHPLKNP